MTLTPNLNPNSRKWETAKWEVTGMEMTGVDDVRDDRWGGEG